MVISKNLKDLAKLFNSKATLFITGDAVKNFILNEKPLSYELTSTLNLDNLIDLLVNTKFIVKVKNAKQNTATIYCENEFYNYYCLNNTKKEQNIIEILNQDILNKDFTFNSLYFDINENKIIDVCNFKKDVENKIIKLISDKNLEYSIFTSLNVCLQQNFKFEDSTKQKLIKSSINLIKANKSQRKDWLFYLLNLNIQKKEILSSLIEFDILSNIFSTKLKRNFINISLKEFPLSLQTSKKIFLETFFIDLINYLKSTSTLSDCEIINYTIGKDGLNLDKEFNNKIKKIISALNFRFNNSNYIFFIYLYNDILNDYLQIKNEPKQLKLIFDELKNENIPTSLNEIKITKKDLFKFYPNIKNYNANKLLKKIFLQILNKKLKNTKQDIKNYLESLN
jgi:tRNA nucleotidyltransferase/poly(A) polymerase